MLSYLLLYFGSASVAPYHANYLVVDFQNQNRCHRYTRLCPYIVLDMLTYTPCLQILPVVSSCDASSPRFHYSPSVCAAACFLFPASSIPSCSHHLQETQAPGLRTDRSQRSRIGRVAIYCAVVFYLFWMYTPISSNTASSIADASSGYFQPPSPCLPRLPPVDTLRDPVLKIPRARSVRGVSTHVSDPKINTACTTILNNIPDTLGSAPSRPSILVSGAQLFRAFFKFPTTNGCRHKPSQVLKQGERI